MKHSNISPILLLIVGFLSHACSSAVHLDAGSSNLRGDAARDSATVPSQPDAHHSQREAAAEANLCRLEGAHCESASAGVTCCLASAHRFDFRRGCWSIKEEPVACGESEPGLPCGSAQGAFCLVIERDGGASAAWSGSSVPTGLPNGVLCDGKYAYLRSATHCLDAGN
jgi:hypothetical protein